MTLSLDIGILLALACAFVANLAFFYKYRGANSVAGVTVRHPLRSARALYSSGWFALGMLIAVASWGLHVAALAMARMSVIQVSLAAGVVFIAVMAERMFGFEVGRRQWLGLVSTASGLITLGMTLPAMHGAHGILAIALSPWFAVALGASVVAFYASARGLQDGEAVPVIAVTGTAANIAGIAGGIIVFGDPMAGSPLGIAMQAAAFVLIILASALMPAPLRIAGAPATA